MAKRTLEFRDVYTTMNSCVWRDRRNGASAISLNTLDGVTRGDLAPLFKAARVNGIVVDRKHPLIVYGTHCSLGETETFTFVQMTVKELAALDEAIYQASCSTAVTS
jgi:hypothetical protein